MWVDVLSLICPLSAGRGLSPLCSRPQGKMASARVLSFAVFLFLTVHGNAVVARVRFTNATYIVREGPRICLGVVNELHDPESPPTERIIVTASIDRKLLGINNPGTLSSSVQILPNTSYADLCFSHRDDNITCEAPIIGNVRLLSSPIVAVGNPSSAQVTVMDDDATEVSFMETSYTYKEGGLLPSQSFPMIKICKKQSDVTLTVTGSHVSYAMLQPSLNFPETTLVATNLSLSLPLQFTDDQIALETTEVVQLELNFVPSPEDRCDNVNIVPNKTANIYIEDDDVATMRFATNDMTVSEIEGHAQICVTISHVIATPIEFELVPQSGTAEAGLDFSASRPRGQFEAMSTNRSLCFSLPVLSDDLVETEESFFVSLRLRTILSRGLRDGLVVDDRQLRVTILDSSTCETVDIGLSNGGKDSSTHYISKQKTVCFTCGSVAGGSPSMELFWLFGEEKLYKDEANQKGRVFPNGTFMIYNSSDAFNTENATRITCVNNSENLESQSAVVYLGTSPSNISLSYKTSDSNQDMTLTCSYTGSPQPSLEWLRDNTPVPERPNNSITVHKSTSTFDSHLTLSIQPGQSKFNYSCVVSNQFGSSSRSIVISVSVPATGPGSVSASQNSALSTNTVSHLTHFTMVLCHILMLAHLLS